MSKVTQHDIDMVEHFCSQETCYSPCQKGNEPMSAEKKRYYRTVVQVEILSQTPYEFQTLEHLAADLTDGDCSGQVKVVSSQVVNGKQMAKLLFKQGSDPEFFSL
jgi:hypothetical protein